MKLQIIHNSTTATLLTNSKPNYKYPVAVVNKLLIVDKWIKITKTK